MTAAEREVVLDRYRARVRAFDELAARRDAQSGSVPHAGVGRPAGPSPRELAVIALAADGLQNTEIAQRLYLSEETVKTHVRNVLAKLGARNRTHAVALAIRAGLIDCGCAAGTPEAA